MAVQRETEGFRQAVSNASQRVLCDDSSTSKSGSEQCTGVLWGSHGVLRHDLI